MSDPIDTAQDGQANPQDHQPSESSSPHLHHDSLQSTTWSSPPTDQKQRQDSEGTVQDQEETSRKNERKDDEASNSEPSTSTSDLPPPQQSRSVVAGSMATLASNLLGPDGKDSKESRRIDLLRRGGTHSGDARSMGNVNTRTSQDGQATASSNRDRSSVPPESSSNVPPQTMNPSSQSQSQSPPTPTSRQVPRTSTLPQAPVLPQFPPAMTSRSIRLTKHAARKLLSETACPTCSQALHEPITLPCGHTECLSCIYSRIGADLPTSSSSSYENNRPDGSPRNSNLNPRPAYKRGSSFTPKLPCSTHVPPRLPLTPSTVPCPDQTCPRSTVGRGLGLWAGHTARYTSSLEDYPGEQDVESQGSTSPGPGKPPVDGFVVGLPTHTKRLQVIGAQPRSQAHSFASIPSSTNPSSSSTGQGTNEASETSNEGLRTDVTLAKAMAVIRRYAGQPTPPASPPRRALALAALRRSPGLPGGAEYMARRGATGRGAGRNSGRSRGSSTSAYVKRSGAVGGSRGLYSSANRFNPPSAERRRSLIAFSGRREEDMESGTVNGVRAVWDTDEDDEEGDEDEYGDAGKYEDGRYSDGDGDETMAYDDGRDSELEDFHSAAEFDWPGGIGGAAARHIPSPTQQHQSRSSTPSGVVFPNSGRRGSEVHQSDLKRRRRNLNSNASANASNANHGGRSSQRGRTRIRQVSDVHQYVKRHDDVASGLSVGEDEWDTEDGSSIPGSELGLEDERMQDSRDGRESHSKTSAPLTRNLSSSSSDIDYNFHSRDHQHQYQSYSDQITASKLIDAGKAPLPTDGGIAALQSPQAGLAAMHAELVDVLECQLCYLVLYEPVTSPCGHTFCKTCLARSLDHSDRCPLCRSNLPNFAYFAEHPPNGSLVRLLTSEIELPSSEEEDSSHRHHQPQLNSLYGPQSNSSFSGLPFPTSEADESEGKKANTWGLRPLFEERKAAVEQEERENRLSTPIFVCTLAFPGMPTVLHVFEPRYRLMIRRCLESGNPRFGMVLPSRIMSGPTPGVSEYGTMLEIRSVQMLADGRSMIETVGSYRFRLLDKGALDGYTVGHIERYDDISPEEEAELEAAAMRRNQELDASNPTTSTNTVSANASSNANSTGNPSTSAEEPESPRMPGAAPPSLLPPPSTPGTSEREREQSTEELIATCVSFIETIKSGSAPWLMTRLNSTYGPMPEPHEVEKFGYWIASVMPIDEHEKAKLLPIRSPRLRLRLVVHWIDQLRRSWWFNGGCTVS